MGRKWTGHSRSTPHGPRDCARCGSSSRRRQSSASCAVRTSARCRACAGRCSTPASGCARCSPIARGSAAARAAEDALASALALREALDALEAVAQEVKATTRRYSTRRSRACAPPRSTKRRGTRTNGRHSLIGARPTRTMPGPIRPLTSTNRPDARRHALPRPPRRAARSDGRGHRDHPTAPERIRNRDSDYLYRFDSYFYYLAGFPEPEAVLVMVAGPESRSILFCREKHPERELWEGFRYGPEGARKAFGFDDAQPFAALDEALRS